MLVQVQACGAGLVTVLTDSLAAPDVSLAWKDCAALTFWKLSTISASPSVSGDLLMIAKTNIHVHLVSPSVSGDLLMIAKTDIHLVSPAQM